MNKKLLLLPLLLTILICKAQTSERKLSKADQLCALISKLFLAARNEQTIFENNRFNAPSEAIIITLEIDSIGNVSDIHLLSDSRNKDSAYIILSTWKVADFASWKDETYKGKTIMRDTVIKAMCYGGLQLTTAWKSLPFLGIDTCKYNSINLSSQKSLTGGNEHPSGCTSSPVLNYSTDLKLRPACH